MEWKTMVENSSGLKIKTLRIDNGEEYTSREFEDYLRQKGIHHERTVHKTLEQNESAGRMKRTLVETVRAMLSDSKLPKKFWAKALSKASYIRNRSRKTEVQAMSLNKVRKGYKPYMKHLRIFGSSAKAHLPKDKRSKNGSWSEGKHFRRIWYRSQSV